MNIECRSTMMSMLAIVTLIYVECICGLQQYEASINDTFNMYQVQMPPTTYENLTIIADRIDMRRSIVISYLAAVSQMSKDFQERLRQHSSGKVDNRTNVDDYAEALHKEMDCFRPEFAGNVHTFSYHHDIVVGSTISGAIVVAIDDINHNPSLLSDYRLSYVYDNTCGNKQQGSIYMMAPNMGIFQCLYHPCCTFFQVHEYS